MQRSPTAIYKRLLQAYGPQDWWPGESPFEVMVGAVLVQNTAWKNVAQAIEQMRQANVLSPHRLDQLPQGKLEDLVRSAGYFRLKAQRLRNLNDWLIAEFDGNLDRMFRRPLEELRGSLLKVNGIGPETADSILLYAGELPAFVVDTYTARVMQRHGWLEPGLKYHDIQRHFVERLPEDVPQFNEFHALLVRVGHLHCRKIPKCEACPLQDWLPEGGPLE